MVLDVGVLLVRGVNPLLGSSTVESQERSNGD